jgi:hypothetical protein
MIAADENIVPNQRRTAMKKLMTLMLGLAFLTATVGVTFAQDQPPKKEEPKKGKKKGGKKKEETPKKEGQR